MVAQVLGSGGIMTGVSNIKTSLGGGIRFLQLDFKNDNRTKYLWLLITSYKFNDPNMVSVNSVSSVLQVNEGSIEDNYLIGQIYANPVPPLDMLINNNIGLVYEGSYIYYFRYVEINKDVRTLHIQWVDGANPFMANMLNVNILMQGNTQYLGCTYEKPLHLDKWLLI